MCVCVCFSLCKGSHLIFKVQPHFYSFCMIRKNALTKPASKINPGQEEFPYMKSTKTKYRALYGQDLCWYPQRYLPVICVDKSLRPLSS